ncbi:hypothetical protein QBC35DRAFT_500219 [Podospora australis]|uniref:Uncharacterized protein n=1 Tax=Podospora australis TaxID=1536484 RepID=A0AAN6WRP8_9PEZI|nr:hypothetical protein QBC35DRAFT_500219 [Podospora australis]
MTRSVAKTVCLLIILIAECFVGQDLGCDIPSPLIGQLPDGGIGPPAEPGRTTLSIGFERGAQSLLDVEAVN